MMRARSSRERSRWMILLVLGIFSLGRGVQAQGTAGVSKSQPPQKAVWRWTLSERLAARFDPKAEEARAAQREIRSRSAFPRSPSPVVEHPAGHFIRGDETPELFLSFELFDALINRSFPPDGLNQSAWRRRYEERAAALGLGRDLWPRIEKAAESFLERKRHHYRRSMTSLVQQDVDQSSDRVDVAACRARAEAMAAVAAELGNEKFLRLLYEAVAPSLHMSYSDREDLSDHLRFVEGGCR